MGAIVAIGYALILMGAVLRYFNVPRNIAINIQMWLEMRRICRSKTIIILYGDYDRDKKLGNFHLSRVDCSNEDAIGIFMAAAEELRQEEALLNEAKVILNGNQ